VSLGLRAAAPKIIALTRGGGRDQIGDRIRSSQRLNYLIHDPAGVGVPAAGASFFCASVEAHWIVATDPTVRLPLVTVVLDVRLIVQLSAPLCNAI
jgi:hypothetical protein